MNNQQLYKIRGACRTITKDEIFRIMSFNVDEKPEKYFQYRGYAGYISYKSPFKMKIDDKIKNVGSFLCGYVDFDNHNYLWNDEIENIIFRKTSIIFTELRGFDHAHYDDIIIKSRLNKSNFKYNSRFYTINKKTLNDVSLVTPERFYINHDNTFSDVSLATPEFVINNIKQIINIFIEFIINPKAIIIQKHFRGMLGRRYTLHLKYKPGGPGYELVKKNWYGCLEKYNI